MLTRANKGTDNVINAKVSKNRNMYLLLAKLFMGPVV
jgi:hypothetical protein